MMNSKSDVLEIGWWILDRFEGEGGKSSGRIERWKGAKE